MNRSVGKKERSLLQITPRGGGDDDDVFHRPDALISMHSFGEEELGSRRFSAISLGELVLQPSSPMSSHLLTEMRELSERLGRLVLGGREMTRDLGDLKSGLRGLGDRAERLAKTSRRRRRRGSQDRQENFYNDPCYVAVKRPRRGASSELDSWIESLMV